MPASSPGGGLKTGAPRHRDCVPSVCHAGFGSGGRRSVTRAVGRGAGNPSRPRSHPCRPRRRLAGLPDRLGTLEERHPGPRVRGLRAVHVRAAPGGRTRPACRRPVQRMDSCGFRTACHAAAIPAEPPPDQNRPRPSRRSVRPGTPPSSARFGSSRSATPLRPARAPEHGTHSGARTSRTWSAGAARRQPGRRRRRLHRESPHRKRPDRKSETARLLPAAPGTGRRFPKRNRPQKSPPTPVKSRVPRHGRGDCDRMRFRS